ncbi:MAG: hypothetical protein HC836_31290, partial [Richelia sp. RM2_1_2]|nr:hypothetical protein [Richelia sp. RM2_1_2]
MYVDAIYSKKHKEIFVVERDEHGKRVFKKYPAKHVFYYSDPKGQYTTIFGTKVSKYETSDEVKFKKELSAIRDGKRIYESDINPIFRCLEDNYAGAEGPELHIGIFDIEVNFNPEQGFSSPENPYAEINAISLHQSWCDELLTFVLKPDTMTEAQSHEVVRKFSNVTLCKTEKELLKLFLDAIEDVDVLSGWNCISKNEFVYLENKIKKLGDITQHDDSKIIAWHDSDLKRKNILTLVTGQSIDISDEHVIPVCFKPKRSYKYPNTLLNTQIEKNVKEIKELLPDHDIFVTVPKRKNKNTNQTYKDLLLNNLDIFLEGIDIRIDCERLQTEIYNKIKTNNFTGPYIRPGRGYAGKSQIIWRYSLLKTILDKQTLIDYIKKSSNLHIFTTPTVGFNLCIDQCISDDYLRLLGFVFTDGFYSTYDREFSICNKDHGCISKYLESINKAKEIKKRKDGCYYARFSTRNSVGFLKPLIYSGSKKHINVELLSQLSESQFLSFLSGCIDGDGSIGTNRIELCNFDNNIKNLTVLCSWNGLFTYTEKNVILIPNKGTNLELINLIKLHHSVRSRLLENIKEQREKKNSPASIIRYFEFDDHYLVRVNSILETNELIPMADIMTESHYFVCNGVKVHNSEFFDIPYIIERIKNVLGVDYAKKMCLWNEAPKLREIDKFGKTQITYDLVGRVSLDYLELFRKHSLQQYHSYRLDFIGEQEVGEKKIAYDGTLDQLFKKDFYKFIEYNQQDVALLVKIDKKNRFIDLASQVAHTNCVLLKTTLGAVALIDQAIVNEAHHRGMIVQDKPRMQQTDEMGAAGAYVADPKVGLHEEIGAVDINSLYPSVIRSLNMCTETLVGQVSQTNTKKIIADKIASGMSPADAWHGMFGSVEYNAIFDRNEKFEVCVEIGNLNDQVKKRFMSAAEAHDFIFDPANNLCISANGTIFRTDV